MSLNGTNAGFRYTVDSQPRVHALNYPMKLDLAPGNRTRRYASDSLDLSEHEVISIGNGRGELEATLRFNRNSQGLIDTLRHAANGVVLTYYPNLANGTGYPLWLVSGGDAIDLAWDAARFGLGDYQVRVRFRDASASGTTLQALFDPLLFRWEAGDFPVGYSFSRTGTASYVDSDGVLKSAATGVARIDWPLVDGVRVPAYLGEAARTNLVLQSEDLSTTWTNDGTPTIGTAHTASGVSLDLLGDDNAAATESKRQVVAFTGDGDKAISFHIKKGTSSPGSGSDVLLRDTTASASRLVARVTWTGTVPSVNMLVGTHLFTQQLADGVYRIGANADSVVAANTNQLRLYASRNDQVADTGNVYVGGIQAEDATSVSSYVQTTTGTVTRNADTLDLPIAFQPQVITAYFRIHWRGMAAAASDGAGVIAQIGRQTTGNGAIQIDNGTSSVDFRVALVGGNGTASLRSVNATGVAVLDELEVCVQIDSSFSQIVEWAVGGGSVTTTASATNADGMPASWAADYIRVSREGLLGLKVAAGTHSLAAMRAK